MRTQFPSSSSEAGTAAALVGLGTSPTIQPSAAAEMLAPAPGRYPFGLSEAQEKHAERLHRESIIFDAMYQGPGGMNIYDLYDPALLEEYLNPSLTGWAAIEQAEELPWKLALEGKSDLIKRFWEAGGVTCGPLGITPAYPSKELQESRARSMKPAELPWLRFVTTAQEVRQAKKDGVYAAYGYCQPVAGLPADLSTIDDAYKAGLRTLMLTYNLMDYVGGGCTECIDVGLSHYGTSLVKRCNELGLQVDTSHCGRQTTLDACKFSKAPVIANHTCAAGVYQHARAKDDVELRALADTGGVIGVVALPAFLTNTPNPTIEVMLDHIDYIAQKVGWQHVGIGTDNPIQTTRKIADQLGPAYAKMGFRPEDGILDKQRTLLGYEDGRDWPNVTRGLLKRGYSDEQVKGIIGENFMRVFEQVCG